MRGFFGFGMVAVLLFATGSTWIGLYPPFPKDLDGAHDFDSEARRVSIPVGDDDRLDGWWLPGEGRGVVVVFHGYGRTHHRAWRYAGFLNRAGYHVVTVDFRSSRMRGRKPTTLGHYELFDARATLDWVRSHPVLGRQPLGLLGESLGGSVALLVSAERDEVEALVVDAPFADGREAIEGHLPASLKPLASPCATVALSLIQVTTGHDARTDCVAAATRLSDRAVFFIAAEKDTRVPAAQTVRLWRAAGAKDSLWVIPGIGHNEGWQRDRAEYEKRVLRFMAQHLRDKRTGPVSGPTAAKPS